MRLNSNWYMVCTCLIFLRYFDWPWDSNTTRSCGRISERIRRHHVNNGCTSQQMGKPISTSFRTISNTYNRNRRKEVSLVGNFVSLLKSFEDYISKLSEVDVNIWPTVMFTSSQAVPSFLKIQYIEIFLRKTHSNVGHRSCLVFPITASWVGKYLNSFAIV